MNKTYINNNNPEQWFYIDVKDQTLGRISTQIANNLKNKYSIYYTPYQINKFHIIVINADKIKVSGQKKIQKIYKRHSGRPGGLKGETFIQLQKRLPERIIEKAIKGMLPKNTLGRRLFTSLKIYSGSNHPHQAQKPIALPIK
jgi:large subunit ribosomal protein L13